MSGILEICIYLCCITYFTSCFTSRESELSILSNNGNRNRLMAVFPMPPLTVTAILMFWKVLETPEEL